MNKEQVIRPWQVMKIRGAKGMIYSWVWEPMNRCYVLEFLYWQYIVWLEDRPASQVLRLVRLGFWSGFMSEARGLSWDRKSRYGKK